MVNNSISFLRLLWELNEVYSQYTLAITTRNQEASQMALVVKDLPTNAGDIRDPGLIPRSERSTGEEDGNPLQYSCLENPMDRGAQQGYSPWGCKESDKTDVI